MSGVFEEFARNVTAVISREDYVDEPPVKQKFKEIMLHGANPAALHDMRYALQSIFEQNTEDWTADKCLELGMHCLDSPLVMQAFINIGREIDNDRLQQTT